MARPAENPAGVIAASAFFAGAGLLELILGLGELPEQAGLWLASGVLGLAFAEAPVEIPRSLVLSSFYEVPSCVLLLPFLRSPRASLLFPRPLLGRRRRSPPAS